MIHELLSRPETEIARLGKRMRALVVSEPQHRAALRPHPGADQDIGSALRKAFTRISRSKFIRRAGRLLKTGSTHVPDYQRYLSLLKAERSSFAGRTFNLTIDFELGWSRARRDGGSTTRQEALQRAQRARAAFPALLEASDRYAVPITFAVVGHLAMARCEHPPTPAFAPYWLGEDWFAIDPSTDGDRDPAYYAADAIEAIARGDVAHEIGSHGFSHVDLGDDATTREIATYEIVESRNALRRYDPAISSFIFPKNHLGFLDVLSDAGFTAYRSGAYLPSIEMNMACGAFPRACGSRRRHAVLTRCSLLQMSPRPSNSSSTRGATFTSLPRRRRRARTSPRSFGDWPIGVSAA